jgi:hypothetical protein
VFNSKQIYYNLGEGQTKKIASLWIVGLLMLVITASGCISFDNSVDNPYVYDKAFSKDGISFQYPSNWKTNSLFGYVVELQSPNGDFTITIQKISLDNAETAIKELNEQNKQELMKSKTTIVNETTLNVNGLTVYEMITSLNSTSIGSLNKTFFGSHQKDLFVITGKGQNAYIMQFSSPDDNSFDKHLPEFNQMISTIKIR